MTLQTSRFQPVRLPRLSGEPARSALYVRILWYVGHGVDWDSLIQPNGSVNSCGYRGNPITWEHTDAVVEAADMMLRRQTFDEVHLEQAAQMTLAQWEDLHERTEAENRAWDDAEAAEDHYYRAGRFFR